MSWQALESFDPTSMRAALAEVEVTHRRSAELTTSDRKTTLEQLRAILEKTAESDLPDAVLRMSRRMLLVAPDLVATEGDASIARKARIVAVTARMVDVAARAWKLVVLGGVNAELHELLRGYAEHRWVAKIAPEELDRSRFLQWLNHASLAEALLADREESGAVRIADWAYSLPNLVPKLSDESPVWSAFWYAVLAHGNAETLRGEGPSFLVGKAEQLGEAAVDDFIQNYVVRLREGRRWSPRVIDWAVKKRRRPDPAALVGVWRGAEARNPGVIQELSNWLALRTLRDFFGKIRDPHGRFEFWNKNFADQLLAAERLCDGEAAMLQFPGIVVVEFGEVGNAAYVYPDSEAGWIRRRRVYAPSGLKDKTRLIRTSGEGYRIVHREGWQTGAASEIRTLLKFVGRR